jgi:serine-type D-Ala-D-Ala carboxypeptidase (penicillin-binding protein 5/6)
MKKLTSIILLFFLLFTSFFLPIYAEEQSGDIDLAENSKSAILMEKDTGEILYNKNADERLPPASMTKIMTLILIMEALEKGQITLNEKVRVSEHAASMGGSQIFLEAGEEMTVEDLLKGIAIASGNDASVALAEKIAGSEKAFVIKMNEKVKSIGLKNTHFVNSTGLPAENHYSTAHDMAVMAKELLKYEDITKYTSIYEDYLRKGTEDEFWLVNTNKLVRFYDGVDGLKTGYTSEAKYCLTATAKRGDMRVIAVAMGADTTKKRNADVSAMLDYAFSQYNTMPVFERHEVVDQLKLLKAEKEKIDVVTEDKISILIKNGEKVENVEKLIEYDKNLTLPIEQGKPIGILKLKVNGKIVSETPLVVQEKVEEAGVWTLMKRAMRSLHQS